MPRNITPNHFDYAGIYVEGKRSVFPYRKVHHASFMSGVWVPLGDPIPCLPGQKYDLKINSVIRSNTMNCPPLDPMVVDFIAVFVPHRIVWNNFPQFLGENDTTAWTQAVELIYPSYDPSAYDVSIKTDWDDVARGNFSLYEHYGLIGTQDLVNSIHINVLAFRGYYAIWNYLLRDENYQRPVLFSKGDTGNTGEFGYVLINYKNKTNSTLLADLNTDAGSSLTVGDGIPFVEAAVLMPANKLHDFATSVLPQPQYGDAVSIGLGGYADVVAGSSLTALGGTLQMAFDDDPIESNSGYLTVDEGIAALNTSTSSLGNTSTRGIGYTNLKAKLSTATAVTINALRSAVMAQRFKEALSRSGRRVPEFYSAIYGVKNSMSAHDYPELLTRSRYILGVNQVVATADATGSGWTSRLGDTGAYSLTTLRDIPCCERDFTEFGYLHILYAVRAENIYSQSIPAHFLRSTLLDEYNPFFDHIGDVAVPNYLINTSAGSFGTFGYQEAWWDVRTQQNLSVGSLNKKYGSLKYWVIGESYGSTLTTCTPAFLCFDPATLDDIFVSNYNVYPQFIGDFMIHGKMAMRMSQHSIPGIVGRI